jgi:hypothetical protein
VEESGEGEAAMTNETKPKDMEKCTFCGAMVSSAAQHRIRERLARRPQEVIEHVR